MRTELSVALTVVVLLCLCLSSATAHMRSRANTAHVTNAAVQTRNSLTQSNSDLVNGLTLAIDRGARPCVCVCVSLCACVCMFGGFLLCVCASFCVVLPNASMFYTILTDFFLSLIHVFIFQL